LHTIFNAVQGTMNIGLRYQAFVLPEVSKLIAT
jgi:hypothetical protein